MATKKVIRRGEEVEVENSTPAAPPPAKNVPVFAPIGSPKEERLDRLEKKVARIMESLVQAGKLSPEEE